MIESAASAASRKPKSREGSSRGVQDGGSAGGQRPRGTPLDLSSLDLGFLEAALAADLITARNLRIVKISRVAGSKQNSIEPLLRKTCVCKIFSTRIKDAGIAIRHSRGYVTSILQGLEMGLREWTRCVPGHKKQVEPIKKKCRNIY